MKVNFVGAFNQPGYVGEISDETHLATNLESYVQVVRIPRDEWREYVIEGSPKGKYKNVPTDLKADINLIAKWHHFYDGSFIRRLREESGAPVFYWIWDFMWDQGFPEWHIKMAQEADLYLSGEAGIFDEYKKLGVKPYYFQMDVCDGDLPNYQTSHKKYDVVFTGSCIGQGHRKEWLQIIDKEVPVKIFGWGHEEWRKLGLDAEPPVYGAAYNKLISESKVVLGFSAEPNCYGYWSNRVGKVLTAGGFLLQEYAPGMEWLLPQGIAYFNTPKEAIAKIKYFLVNEEERQRMNRTYRGIQYTSKIRSGQLALLMDRYLEGDPAKWNILP